MSIISTLLPVAATLIGTKIAADANKSAARTAAAGEHRSAEEIEAANRLAQERLMQAGKLPTRLTPSQEGQLEDARGDVRGQLAASGLRGSGRATVAAFRDVESDFRNRLLEGERGRRERLATGLSAIDRDTGYARGGAERNTGLIGANATTANAGLRGAAVGSILGAVANEAKERESRRA